MDQELRVIVSCASSINTGFRLFDYRPFQNQIHMSDFRGFQINMNENYVKIRCLYSRVFQKSREHGFIGDY
ncbi:hypothetical protein AAZX31_19G016800 [Glycine max]